MCFDKLAFGRKYFRNSREVPTYVTVSDRFLNFHKKIILTPTQKKNGNQKRESVVSCLNYKYYRQNSTIENSFLIGSWAKDTAVRPPRDIDIYFLLPIDVFNRFNIYSGNKQSALLQEIKDVLSKSFPNTKMKGDGQVVVVEFESYKVEVVPAFLLRDRGYWICNTDNGGSYKLTYPRAETKHIEVLDRSNENILRPLIRMLKIWQAYHSVPIKSFFLELLAADFINQLPSELKKWSFFDYIIYNFFDSLHQIINISKTNITILVPGTLEEIIIQPEWNSNIRRARNYTHDAYEYEKKEEIIGANVKWKKVFGTNF